MSLLFLLVVVMTVVGQPSLIHMFEVRCAVAELFSRSLEEAIAHLQAEPRL